MKAPIGLTFLRPETLADANRASVRGWIGITAGIFVILAILSWPIVAYVALCLTVAAGLVVVAIWVHATLPDAGLEARRRRVETKRVEVDPRPPG
jgi:uncharacterized protein (DUF58 family)